MIRPEDVYISNTLDVIDSEDNQLELNIQRCSNFGAYIRLELTGSIPLVVHLSHSVYQQLRPEVGEKIIIKIKKDNIHIMDS